MRRGALADRRPSRPGQPTAERGHCWRDCVGWIVSFSCRFTTLRTALAESAGREWPWRCRFPSAVTSGAGPFSEPSGGRKVSVAGRFPASEAASPWKSERCAAVRHPKGPADGFPQGG